MGSGPLAPHSQGAKKVARKSNLHQQYICIKSHDASSTLLSYGAATSWLESLRVELCQISQYASSTLPSTGAASFQVVLQTHSKANR